MRTKAVIKKMAALGTGIAMMGATMAGAFAADLVNYPNDFMDNGQLNAAIAVGDGAAVIDVVGAIDVAFSLQYAARVQKEVSLSGSTTVTASDGVEVSATGNHLTLGEALSTVESQFKKDDLPVLLADGTVRDDSDNEDYDYSQKLRPSADVVVFGNADDDVFGDFPLLYLDQSSGVAYTIQVEFDTAINVTALVDSEKIDIMGKTFTFDPDMTSGDTTLVLYASEKTETISVGETKDVALDDGTTLTITLVGANTDGDSATLRVNGKSYSVTEGDTITPGDTSLYINDVFTYNIPAPGAAVEFFVGSDKIEIDASGGYQDIDVDDDTLTGVKASVAGGLAALTELNFTVTPSEFDLKDFKYLLMGESLEDPLFGTFEMKFAGVTPELKSDAKTKITLSRSSDDYKLAFVNKDAEAYEFEVFTGNGANDAVIYHEDFLGAENNVTDDKIFILNEVDVTKVYQLRSVTTENSIDYANIRDLTDNEDFKAKQGDEIGDSGVTVDLLDATDDWINLSSAATLTIYTRYDGVLTIGDPTNTATWDLTFLEGTDNFDDIATGDAVTLRLNISGTSSDGDEDITIGNIGYSDANDVDVKADEDNEIEFGVTLFGTYWEREKENNGAYIDIYYPKDEQHFHVFFMPSGATTTTSAGGESITYYDYNRIEIGAAKLASEILDVTAQNLIVVGGPCANSVAARLLNNPEPCYEGFEEGKALLKLIENGNKVALLVAGYSGPDTRLAAQVLANYGNYDLRGSEMVVVGTTLSDVTVEAPTVE